ncbi:30S ribosomal protein S9 [bacterium]|jgi:small subunit ribosomal protein S9|nr:30S ribosomal protein S9 [bacterium]
MEKEIHHIGKRKTAVARVYLRPRKGEVGAINVNGRSLEDYFPRPALQKIAMQSLNLTNNNGQYDIFVNVAGGGISAQATAIRHGIARVLNQMDVSLRPVLKKEGYLTRDAREVERKKYGLAGARRRFQFSKR